MNKILILLVFAFSLQCCGQEKETTYWEIEKIYREDKKPFIGLTGYYMQEIFDNNFHFMKRNDSLYFELPKKFALDLKTFKSLRQINITNREYYEMYNYKFNEDNFVIKFKDNATSSESKNTIIEFRKISKNQFEKNISDAIAYQKEVDEKMSNFKKELENNPPILLENVRNLPIKKTELLNDKNRKIKLFVPNEIELKECGNIKNEKFCNIKIGTIKDNSKVYDIVHPKEDFGLEQLTIYISTIPSKFSIEEYISENDNMVIVKKENDNIVGYTISYDFEEEKAIIGNFFTLKYYNIGKSHIFIYSEVLSSFTFNNKNRNSNKDYLNEMNKTLNFNYLISENIKLYDE